MGLHGLMTTTDTPAAATSLRRAWLKPSTPHLLAQYTLMLGAATCPAGDDTITMRPGKGKHGTFIL